MSVPFGLLLTRDLMFTSKITSTATTLGFRVDVVGTVEQLQARLVEATPRVVFLDLNCLEFDPASTMNLLPTESRPHVIAFGSHIDVARLDEARAAGCDEVMPRSKFSAALPEVIRRAFGCDDQCQSE